MELSSPGGIFIVTVSLVFVLYLLHGFARTFSKAKCGLNEIGQAVLTHAGDMEKVKKMFYLHPWTREEANAMIQNLRRQLAIRLNLYRTPELTALGNGTTQTLLVLAIFAKIVLSTEEIRRRIEFLETFLRNQENSPSTNRSLLLS